MLQGSSIDDEIANKVINIASSHESIMVVLDSNHTHEHVLAELRHYASLVSPGNYLVVFDTAIEHMDPDSFPDRPWDIGNNPMTAVHEYLETCPDFEIDKDIESKLLITVAPSGYLRCKKI
jgi:cephalosporin hydroxylase